MSDFKSGTLGRLSGERGKRKERRGKGERRGSEKRGREERWERGINCSDTLRNLYNRQPGKLATR